MIVTVQVFYVLLTIMSIVLVLYIVVFPLLSGLDLLDAALIRQTSTESDDIILVRIH